GAERPTSDDTPEPFVRPPSCNDTGTLFAGVTHHDRFPRDTHGRSVLGSWVRPKLLDQVRDTIRMRHYSRRTENTYVHWIRRFIRFTTRNIRRRWEPGDHGRSYRGWRPANVSAHRRRIRR